MPKYLSSWCTFHISHNTFTNIYTLFTHFFVLFTHLLRLTTPHWAVFSISLKHLLNVVIRFFSSMLWISLLLCLSLAYNLPWIGIISLSFDWPDDESQLKEDEQLAKAIQESLNVESPPRYGNGNIYQPIPFPYSTGFRYTSSLCQWYFILHFCLQYVYPVFGWSYSLSNTFLREFSLIYLHSYFLVPGFTIAFVDSVVYGSSFSSSIFCPILYLWLLFILWSKFWVNATDYC